MALKVLLTQETDVSILNCPCCDTALLPAAGDPPRPVRPAAAWAQHPAPVVWCPLCRYVEAAAPVAPGDPDAFRLNPDEQWADLEATPFYLVEAISVQDEVVLLDAPDLLDDPGFAGLQAGYSPAVAVGWAGSEGAGLDPASPPGYRLFLVVQVAGEEATETFRLLITGELVGALAQFNPDRDLALVSQRKGAFLTEAAALYLQALAEQGARPGAPAELAAFATLAAPAAPEPEA